MQSTLELRVLSKSLELRVQCRHRRFVALKSTKCNKHHALFKMRHLNAAGVVLELDLVSNTAHIVVGKRRMQVYFR